ncbi:hypothetical protein D3C87_2050340 [compost metagenome]
MPGKIIPPQLGGIEPDAAPAIEEQRVVAAELIVKQPGKFVEIDPAVADGKAHHAIRANADATAPGLVCRIGNQHGMQLPVNHQHRP